MNKELIKAYFEEFKHWLNGGNVQVYYKKDDEPKWLTDEECIEYEGHDNFNHIMQNSLEPEDVLIIIDDSYSHYRKAMAEGKIVEAAIGYSTLDGYIWESIEDDKFHLYDTDELRIKPERHKFKKGDWVIHNGKYKRVTKVVDGYIDSLDNEVAVIMKEESLELWEPKEEEYFWYKNDLVKFDEIKTNCGTLLNSVRGCSYYTAEANYKEYCEPFVGQLPTNIREYKKG